MGLGMTAGLHIFKRCHIPKQANILERPGHAQRRNVVGS